MIVTVKKCLNCGVDHEWLFEVPTLQELRVIKKLTGMGQKAFAAAGDDGDPEALAALLYILHKRSRIEIPFDDIDLDFSGFDMKLTEEEQREADALEKRMEAAASEAQAPKVAKSGNGR